MFIAANIVVAALDIKTRDAKLRIFFANFYVREGGGVGVNCLLCPGCPMGKDRPCTLRYDINVPA
jgi:hypothetical protein